MYVIFQGVCVRDTPIHTHIHTKKKENAKKKKKKKIQDKIKKPPPSVQGKLSNPDLSHLYPSLVDITALLMPEFAFFFAVTILFSVSM